MPQSNQVVVVANSNSESVVKVEYNAATNTISITHQDGSVDSFVVNDKHIVSASLSGTDLIMTKEDNSSISVDLSSLAVETITSLDFAGDILIYKDENNVNKLIDLSQYNHLNKYIPLGEKGAPDGVATLDLQGKIPTIQLPSYVDDVLEFDTAALFPATGERGKIYVSLDDNKTFRWSGSTYVEISASLVLGETISTAYRGDRGKAAYDHSLVVVGNPHNVKIPEIAGLQEVTDNAVLSKSAGNEIKIAEIVKITQANYDAIGAGNYQADKMYVIVE